MKITAVRTPIDLHLNGLLAENLVRHPRLQVYFKRLLAPSCSVNRECYLQKPMVSDYQQGDSNQHKFDLLEFILQANLKYKNPGAMAWVRFES